MEMKWLWLDTAKEMATELGLENAEAKYCLPQTCNNYHELTFRLRRIKGEKSCKFPFTNILKNIGKSFPKAVQLQNLRRKREDYVTQLIKQRKSADWYMVFQVFPLFKGNVSSSICQMQLTLSKTESLRKCTKSPPRSVVSRVRICVIKTIEAGLSLYHRT